MADVGAIIATPHGLSTVVRVYPDHLSRDLSRVVALPLDTGGRDVLPPEYFGVPLPGQAQSAASFVQTLILPSDGPSTSSETTATATETVPLTMTATSAPDILGTPLTATDAQSGGAVTDQISPGEAAPQSGWADHAISDQFAATSDNTVAGGAVQHAASSASTTIAELPKPSQSSASEAYHATWIRTQGHLEAAHAG